MAHCFELFGYDFILDQDLSLWLLEVNSNPCLEVFNQAVGESLDWMVEDLFQLMVDPAFKPPNTRSKPEPPCRFHMVHHPDWDEERCRCHSSRPELERREPVARDVPIHMSVNPNQTANCTKGTRRAALCSTRESR